MAQRLNIPGSSPYEATVGYSRAVRIGQQLLLSGTTASSEGGPLSADAGQQARAALQIIQRVLESQGSCLADVARTRMFVVNLAQNSGAVGAAHGEFFAASRPCDS